LAPEISRMKSLRIFFGDLTHDTVGLATEVFPLNIAFVAAYCKKTTAMQST